MVKLSSIKNAYLKAGQIVGAAIHAPSRSHAQAGLFLLGIGLLTAGLYTGAHAQSTQINYNDEKIAASVEAILTYLEGSFGALIMVAAGLGAILSSAFGQYRAALGCLVVAVGAFILRSIMNTFFNTDAIVQ